MPRIAIKTLHAVRDEQIEERLELRIPLDALQNLELQPGGQVRESVAAAAHAEAVDGRYPLPVCFLQRLVESAKLTVDESGHPGLDGAGVFISGNDMRTDGFKRARLRYAEKAPRASRARAACGGSTQARDDELPAIHPTDSVIGFAASFNVLDLKLPV